MSWLSLEDVGPLPDGAHLLHIGPQKTGSTALQWALHQQRDVLREHGVIYPDLGVRGRYALGAGLGYATPRGGRTASEQGWKRMLAEVHDPRARVVCVSHEAFARGTREKIARTIAELGGERPHVLAVARRYDRVLPSQWQQRVKTRLTLSYEDWLRVVLGPRLGGNPMWRNLWIPHNTVGLVRRWSAVVAPENITVLIADEGDHSLLPELVERMLGVPAGLLAPGGQVMNRSLSYGEVELLREVNRHFEENGYDDERYHRLVNRGLTKALVTAPRHPEDRAIPPLPAWAWEILVKRSRTRVKRIDSLGARVVGDPSLLLLPEQPPEGVLADGGGAADTSGASLTVPLEVAARAVGGVVDAAVREAHGSEADSHDEDRECRFEEFEGGPS